ncbi:helix-turn-helix domain-containing protein [Klebsiella pneumoniae]|uniref:IclR family transcriptional regulator n=1 Tax=Klebsiella pneumoniae TaxID=573 RepID=UPI000C7A3202|nr:helix-turn-helix domain-containing protein [Klebsiella pneumoniae]EIW8473913.1 hypothetical protein [Klebsiella pneumoniae]EIW8489922.1 hypothetical protein [Klebsiella pneumoniae]PLK74502.1 hypothetical protein CWN37_25820 [Klebsiella pneumoniae]PLP33880.1 hypothetical protein CWM88_11985 [Klebsiella pneumoniae]
MTDYRAPALSRGLSVLELLSQTGIPMMMRDIVEALNLSYSQLFRVIQCLEEEGYLRQDDSRYYHLTRKIIFSSKPHFIQQLVQSERCQQLMKEFTWRTNQPCHLAAMQNEQVRVLAHRNPDFTPSISAREGSLLNTVKSSSALLLLALSSEQDSWSLIRHYDLDSTLRATLLEEIVKIQAQGFAEIHHDRIEGLTSISWPVIGVDGYAQAAITCPWFNQLPGEYDEAKQALQSMASALSDMYRDIITGF